MYIPFEYKTPSALEWYVPKFLEWLIIFILLSSFCNFLIFWIVLSIEKSLTIIISKFWKDWLIMLNIDFSIYISEL